MTVYRVKSPNATRLSCISGILISIALLAVWVVPHVWSQGPVALWQQPGVGIAALFCTFATTACLRGLRSVYEIKVFRDGTIIFDRVWGTTTLTAEDIHSLEGHYRKDYDGDLVWEMRLQGSGLRENFDQFDSVMSFVDTVKAHNPNVVITGLWPMGTPR